MGKFDGVLICTDLDGTLLKKDKTISEENLKAIEYFKREGGFFTIVTGRMPFYVT
ncbi:MAG: HAD hydrolase family protein, partial [Clostridia bacterium]|nr:HAD hydrolase family protein [Clostridia bacterium]